MESIYNKIQILIEYLNKCTKAYDEGHPLISDAEWDKKYFELKQLEQETGLILNNSPTQSISFEVVNALAKKEHSHKMLSLEKTKSIEEIINFVGDNKFLAMCKMDGLTCSLTYQNGQLISAETRGNGFVGEDILHNAKIIPSIPQSLPITTDLIVDGEIICTYDDFQQFSDKYMNPRNFAAGSIRLLNSKECAARHLTFVVWDVITPLYFENGDEYTLSQKLNYLKPFGFNVVPFNIYGGNITYTTTETLIKDIKLIAQQHSYPIDGVVVKFDDCIYSRSLGETAHHFKNALAYKFYDDTYETKLLDIEWTLGRTGQISPIAVFETINIDGSNISRASLANLSVMEQTLGNHPFKGQIIEVSKRNQIIPKIERAKDENNKWIMNV